MELTDGIICILDSYNRPAGAGFVVSTATENLIITCAHILGEPRPEQVTIVFQATGKQREAKLVDQWWRPEAAEDVAVLQVVGDLPEQVQPFLLGTAVGTRGHTIHTFGFPNLGEVEGVLGTGEVLGPGAKTKAGQALLQVRSNEITSGFSGAPLWDEPRQRVIGMVVIVAKPDSSGKLSETAFATPTETLRMVCPLLRASDVCPYRSLDAFTEDDTAFFFGRERVVEELVDRLRDEPRFLVVLGPSGSGKSSVVQAGLIPQLRREAIAGSDRWEIIITRPTDGTFGQRLRTLDYNVAVRRVLVIDQFEELFATCSEMDRWSVAMRLTECLESTIPLTIILAIRDDFYSSLVQYEAFAQRFKYTLVNIPAMLRYEEIINIIEKPAQVIGLRFERGLAEVIAKDALERASRMTEGRGGARSTVLPLVEFALSQLWERCQDGMFTYTAYKAIGGVIGGLVQWADREFYSLDEQQRTIARRIFTDLVHLGDESLVLQSQLRSEMASGAHSLIRHFESSTSLLSRSPPLLLF